MVEYYAAEDIYSEDGILLVRKGKKLPKKVIAKLQRYGNFELENLIISNSRLNKNQDSQQNNIIDTTIKTFRARKNVYSSFHLEQSSKILSTIIFESKTSPWWIHINALSNYLDWLYTHSIDVAMISLMIAIELGYSDEELFNMGLAALLHDIGKLLVPKSILEKKEPLFDIEMSFIIQHCELGVSSLEGFEFPEKYTDIVLQHHERLDGSGYPNGLKDREISSKAKIVIIADVADSITAFHPQSKPQNMEVAIKELRDKPEKYPQDLVGLLEKILKS